MKIIFICTGNTCRSPMAEYLLRYELKKNNIDIDVISRGIMVNETGRASEHAIEVMKEYDIDIGSHISKQLVIDDISENDVLLTMTNGQLDTVRYICEDLNIVTDTIKNYSSRGENDVVDPYGKEIKYYKICAEEINDCIDGIVERLGGNV